MQTTTNHGETHVDRIERNKAFSRGQKLLHYPLKKLRKLLTSKVELGEYIEHLKDPNYAEQVRNDHAGQILWILWAGLCLISLVFDSTFTFSSTAASLRDGLTRLFPFVSHRLDFIVALALAATVLVITLCIRFATESLKERASLERTPADSPEVPAWVASVRRKKLVRTGWATVLTILLATAALSEMITLRAYVEIANTTGIVNAGGPAQAGESIATTATHARMLQLVTPYAVTAVLHFLILFLPLPSSSPFLPYPCAPSRAERKMSRVNRRIGNTGRQIFEIMLAVPRKDARDQLSGVIPEDEREAVNQAIRREVFNGSFNPQGTPVDREPVHN